ncbi:hypothetical protein F5Y16DRAFT_414522 [Xylariaceae sp. FL0255]|nr:hypothetical protein F5Y16DRAFT_414522 [Xylariaceae sp. FL0255]
MTLPKSTRLMIMTRDPPHMRIEDTLLELDEAEPTANAMYGVLKAEYEWRWPDQSKHLASWKDERGQCVQDREEDEEDYQDRASRWREWPRLKAIEQARWLRCAMVTSHALQYLHECHSRGESLDGKSPNGFRFAFNARDFYEYVWICLSQGQGTRVWKVKPPMPSKSEEEVDPWYYVSNAQRIMAQTIEACENGIDLEALVPILGLDDMLPAPSDLELFARLSKTLK